MFREFFQLAATSPARQRSLRWAAALHLTVVGILTLSQLLATGAWSSPAVLGHVLLTLGIVEGATLVGWRLTQWPKSQALEFLLVSPQKAARLLGLEALVGLCRLVLISLTGLPCLLLLLSIGRLSWPDVAILLVLPLTWAAITGLGLTAWAYEPLVVRRWGERIALGSVLVYLTVGVLAGERLQSWVGWLPGTMADWPLRGLLGFHRYNPFGIVQAWFTADLTTVWQSTLLSQVLALVAVGVLLLRAATRLQPHFHDRHYRPIEDVGNSDRGVIGDQPLAWWAVRRVMEYSGRVNVWLACGFGSLFSLYVLLGDHWPAWLGKMVFRMLEQSLGGVAGLSTGMTVLAAVPAAFQYGLWDSNAQDRCRRLELLLLTDLQGIDYWRAALLAAWRRGRGYLGVALLLVVSAWWAGRIQLPQLTQAILAGAALLAVAFTLGFRAFTRGTRANGLGMFLTVGMPALTLVLWQAGYRNVAALTPPGNLFAALVGPPSLVRDVVSLSYLTAAVYVTRPTLAHCTHALRDWYSLNHGQKGME